ncbi:MAG TPA: TetR family transcriptional regulator [Candidatus Eisenbacteria bacterium]|nr:TetR family transcriptional regulator [Candidatus Eisenbacteria bacterium]
MDRPGLRERKKRETRRRISDVATGLFAVHGFDRVTVAEIAAAADVSKMTVFNYFPRKEDILFDRDEEAVELLSEAIRGRPPDVSPLRAVRLLLLDLMSRRHPLSGLRDGAQPFWRIVTGSQALQARAREGASELEALAGRLFAEAAGTGPDDPQARLQAALAVTAWRVVYLEAARRLMAGETADAVHPGLAALACRAFDLLEREG